VVDNIIDKIPLSISQRSSTKEQEKKHQQCNKPNHTQTPSLKKPSKHTIRVLSSALPIGVNGSMRKKGSDLKRIIGII